MPTAVDISKFERTLASSLKLRESKGRYVTIFSLDIVGFTAMSEKLGDPEAIKKVVDACFAGFTDVVKRYGAYVDRYQGDAMTAIFGLNSTKLDGDAHAAALAALEVLSQFAPINKELAPKGIPEIACRIGLHTGDVDIAPDQKDNLTATGDIPIFAERIQAKADRGGLLISQDTLRHIDRAQFRIGANRMVAVKDGVPDLEATVIEGTAEDARFPAFNIEQFRDNLIATERLKDGERRNVTVFFMELDAQSTDEKTAGEKLSADRFAAVADAVFELATDVVKQYKAYIDKYQGNSMMVLFGVEATEADCERAILSAMEILDNLPAVNRILAANAVKATLRLGINVGEVTIAPDQKGNVTAMGDVVNTAARLEINAPHDSFLISNEVRLQAGGNYIYSEPQMLALKGKAEKFAAYQVLGVSTKREERWEREQSKKDGIYIGRAAELSELAAIYDRYRKAAGKIKFISIVGPAGYGKSRIIYEFLKRNSDKVASGIFLKGHTLSFSQPPFALFSTMLQRYFDVEGERNKEKIKAAYEQKFSELRESLKGITKIDIDLYKPILGYLVGAEYDDARLQTTDFNAFKTDIHVALRQFLTALAEYSSKKLKRILFIQFEDMHWIDEVSEEALGFLAENLTPRYPILFFGQHRPDYTMTERVQKAAAADYSKVELNPFTHEETEQFVRAIVGMSFPADVVDEIFKKSEGNPFYIEELINSMRAQGIIIEKDGHIEFIRKADFQLPATINALIITRYDLLSSLPKEYLSCGAVIGREFQKQLAISVADKVADVPGATFTKIDVDQVSGILNEAGEKGFIYAREDTVSFLHQTMQEAVYSTLLKDNRKTLHKAVVDAIVQQFVLQGRESLHEYSYDLYYHGRRAEQDEIAIQYGTKAIEKANKDFDLRRVRDVSEDLLTLTKDRTEYEPERFQTLKNFERVLLLQGPKERHTEVVEELLAIATRRNDEVMLAEAKNVKGWQQITVGGYEAADGLGREVLNLNERIGDARIEIKACENIASANFYVQNWDDAKAHFQKMYERGKDIGDLVSEAKGIRGVGLINMFTGQGEQAAEMLQLAVQITDRSGDKLFKLKTLANLGQLYSQYAMHKECYDAFREQYDLAELVGDRSLLTAAAVNLADIYMLIGDYTSAEAVIMDVVNAGKFFADARTTGQTYLKLADAKIRQKAFADAKPFLDDTKDVLQSTNDVALRPLYYTVLSDYYIDQGLMAEAIVELDLMMSGLAETDVFYRMIAMVKKLLCVANTPEALELFGKVEDLLKSMTITLDRQIFYLYIYKAIKDIEPKKATAYLKMAKKALTEQSKAFSDSKFKKGFLNREDNKEIADLYKAMREQSKQSRAKA